MLEVHVPERRECLGARLHHRQDASPRLHGQCLVAILEISVAQVDEVPRIPARTLREALQDLQRSFPISDSRVEVGNARQDFLVGRSARLEVHHELQRAGTIAALQERLALLEYELRVVRRRPNQPFVFADGRVELSVCLQ